ncbi:hypothetical protein [Mycolicibacterium arenosum]|uniref:TrbC/VIRB2 family protein n=1 Tax=Mycolicibacterium arenosum TaxID=2952157 RepID=A0ABT1MCD7_9MYCO|nr:hypothetical protein [Mycolicibacterium sp. CAU 1645]MCP9276836.1 hypothetical protein [Mycolicibacterium sp. CAU 1645]
MITSTLAAADIVTAIPSLWEAIKVPVCILMIMAGTGSAIFSLHRGFGSAAGKMIGGIALAALALGAVGLTVSAKETLDRHSGGILVGQYGN